MNVHTLATRQRRVRHIQSICGRNLSPLVVDGTAQPFHSYITLHMDPSAPAFYQSEVVAYSTNPTWRHLDQSMYNKHVQQAQSRLVVRVWGAWIGRNMVASEENFDLLLEWDVDLYSLEYLAVKVEDVTKAYPKDSLLFGMGSAIYWAPPTRPAPTQALSILKAERSKVRKAYTSSSLLRIITLQRAIQKTQNDVAAIRERTKLVLESRAERVRIQRRIAEIRMHTRLLTAEQTDQTKELKSEHAQLRDARLNVDKRATNLKSSQRSLIDGTNDLHALKAKYSDTRNLLQQAIKMVSIRQTRIILQLHSIYTVAQKSPSQFTICNLELPSSDFSGFDDESIATALGYTAHFVSMVSRYLNLPFRYPITPMCSRSTIRDELSPPGASEKDKEFPLYLKGKDRSAFEHGVLLLNKNIQQLVDACMTLQYDAGSTLENLHLLILHYTNQNENHVREVNSGAPGPSVVMAQAPKAAGHGDSLVTVNRIRTQSKGSRVRRAGAGQRT